MRGDLEQAVLLHQQGRLDEAARRYQALLKREPDSLAARYNLALLLLDRGQYRQALPHLERLARRHPDHPAVAYSLGRALSVTGRTEEAMTTLRKAAELAPGDANVWLALGNELSRSGSPDAAIEAYARTVSLAPRQLAGSASLARELIAAGRHGEAEQVLRRAVADMPGQAILHLFLGRALARQRRFGDAIEAFERAVALQPDLWTAKAYLLRLCRVTGRWDREAELFEELRRRLPEIEREPSMMLPPDLPLLMPFTPEERAVAAGAQARLVAERARHLSPLHLPALGGGRGSRLRIGYLSPDFRTHAVCQLVVDVLASHDRDRVEVFGYSLGPDDGSVWRERARTACDTFRDLRNEPLRAAAAAIAGDRIDVLVDLAVYTQHARPEIPALRPAPVQTQWLGFPGTSGAPWFDYVIADPVVLPAEHEPAFTEKVVRLPHSYQANRRWSAPAAPPSRAALGLPDDAVVFCAVNDHRKIDRASFESWMRILRRVPGSMLWLLEPPAETQERYRAAARAQGIDPARLAFAPLLPVEEHIARLGAADLYLDTLIYGAHTTASEALRAAVPVITWLGPTFSSRVAASLLTAVGLPLLAAPSVEAYEALAVDLAEDRRKRDALRSELLALLPVCPLFDPPRLARHLETAYEVMHRHRRAGQVARTFNVED